jgi:hypothetical protein
MLAMQYSIRLASDFDEARIRQRVAQRGHLFDGMPGLAHKAYLFNAEQHVYAPFYVWDDHFKAREFLLGEIFADVVRAFGRPRVRMWGARDFDIVGDPAQMPLVAVRCVEALAPDADLGKLDRAEREHHGDMLAKRGIWAHSTGLDCDRWELVRYSLWRDAESAQQVTGDCINTYEVLRVSGPAAAPGPRLAIA